MNSYYNISVIIPVYNGETHISTCVEHLLEMEYPREKLDIIVVDNDSKDNTAALAKGYPVKLLKEEKRGSYAARNRGIAEAKGDFIAFTDVDCRVDRYWIKNLLKGFTEESIGGCGGKILPTHVDSEIERFAAHRQILSQENAFARAFLQTANAMYKKDVLAELGGFDEDFLSGGDIDLSWRMTQAGHQIKYVPEALVYHKHRETIKDLFCQFFKYGIGYAALLKKYNKEPERKLRRIEAEYYVYLSKAIVKLLIRYFKKGDSFYKLSPFLDMVSHAGFILGKIRGGLMYRVISL